MGQKINAISFRSAENIQLQPNKWFLALNDLNYNIALHQDFEIEKLIQNFFTKKKISIHKIYIYRYFNYIYINAFIFIHNKKLFFLKKKKTFKKNKKFNKSIVQSQKLVNKLIFFYTLKQQYKIKTNKKNLLINWKKDVKTTVNNFLFNNSLKESSYIYKEKLYKKIYKYFFFIYFYKTEKYFNLIKTNIKDLKYNLNLVKKVKTTIFNNIKLNFIYCLLKKNLNKKTFLKYYILTFLYQKKKLNKIKKITILKQNFSTQTFSKNKTLKPIKKTNHGNNNTIKSSPTNVPKKIIHISEIRKTPIKTQTNLNLTNTNTNKLLELKKNKVTNKLNYYKNNKFYKKKFLKKKKKFKKFKNKNNIFNKKLYYKRYLNKYKKYLVYLLKKNLNLSKYIKLYLNVNLLNKKFINK
jgi:hypothetical protein